MSVAIAPDMQTGIKMSNMDSRIALLLILAIMGTEYHGSKGHRKFIMSSSSLHGGADPVKAFTDIMTHWQLYNRMEPHTP